MNQKVNYKALAISVIAAGLIFGYMLMETGKLEDAAAAHGEKRAALAASSER
ncbi:MAG TPA: hypothetical protein VI168_08960 [Croceibacterium sp.]